jgi:hypothetical protein
MDITLHLTTNFYPPIPHDIQLSCQEFFDKLKSDCSPSYDEEIDQYFIDNEEALEQEWELPNGRTINGIQLLDELRLWDALYWEEAHA